MLKPLSLSLLVSLAWVAGCAPADPESPPDVAATAEAPVTEADVSRRRAKRPYSVPGLDLLAIDAQGLHPELRGLLGDLDGPDHGALVEWRSVVNHVLRVEPDNPHAALMLAHSWFVLDRPEVARRALEGAPEVAATAEWRALLGSAIHVETEDYAGAYAALDAAPDSLLVRYERGRVLNKDRKVEEALELVGQVCAAGLREACVTEVAFGMRREIRRERRAKAGKTGKASRGKGARPKDGGRGKRTVTPVSP